MPRRPKFDQDALYDRPVRPPRFSGPISSVVLPQEPSPPKKSGPFSKLPIELRFEIWSLLLPGPRVVEFEWSDDLNGWFCPRESASCPSILLWINQESRAYYLKNWRPLAPCKPCGLDFNEPIYRARNHRNWQFIRGRSPNEVFNPKIDTLFISNSIHFLGFIEDEHMNTLAPKSPFYELRFLALGRRFFDHLPADSFKLFCLLIEHFPKLESLIIAHGDPFDSSGITKHQFKGSVTFGDNHETNFSARYNARSAARVLAQLKFFLDHADITDRDLKLDYKQIFRGGVKMREITSRVDYRIRPSSVEYDVYCD